MVGERQNYPPHLGMGGTAQSGLESLTGGTVNHVMKFTEVDHAAWQGWRGHAQTRAVTSFPILRNTRFEDFAWKEKHAYRTS